MGAPPATRGSEHRIVICQRVITTSRAVAHVTGIPAATIRDWTRLGLLGRVCHVPTRREGWDILEVQTLADERRTRRRSRAA